jgi:hypothetical protein
MTCFRGSVWIWVLLLVVAAPARGATGRLAFAADLGPDGRLSRVFLLNPDGTGLQPLTPGGGRERSPAFSPDGKQIAYQTTTELGLDTIMIQPADGGQPRALAVGSEPQWSRDGQRLLFARRQVNDYSLYVIKADGTQKDDGLKPVAKGQIGRWSPDEKQLAAVAPVILEGRDRWQIQVLPVDGTDPKLRFTLPDGFGQVVSLKWSPNGESLLFSAVHDAHYELYRVDLKAPELKKLPAGEAPPNPAYGSWSPDGKQILFRSGPDASGTAPAGASRLYLMDADGANVRVLYDPGERLARIHSTDWYHPITVPVNPPPKPVEPEPQPPTPMPMPVPPAVKPKVPGPAKKLYSAKLFQIDPARSPVSVSLSAPGTADFTLSVPVLPLRSWTPRRQGVGITLEMEDGSLYRGTVIYSGVPWVTLQGRPKGGKVRLIDGKKLPAENGGFVKGFALGIRRDGANLIVEVNGQEQLRRPVLGSGVKSLSLTLENFDPGAAKFNLGNVFYRPMVPGGI